MQFNQFNQFKHLQRYFFLFWVGVGVAVILVTLPMTHSSGWGIGVFSDSSPLLHGETSTSVSDHTNTQLSYDVAETEAIAHEHDGHHWYQQGDYVEAIDSWQQALEIYTRGGFLISQVRAWSNISLAYQHLGEWDTAQTVMNKSFALLGYPAPSVSAFKLNAYTAYTTDDQHVDYWRGLAQALNTQGHLYFSIGQIEAAFHVWDQAVAAYREGNDIVRTLQAQLNRVQATQELGHQRQAIRQLTRLYDELQINIGNHHLEAFQSQQLSLLQPAILRQQGDLFRLMGDSDRAQQLLQEGLAIAQQLGQSSEIGAILFSLGQTYQARQDYPMALKAYQQALSGSTDLNFRIRIELAQLQSLVMDEQWLEAETLFTNIQTHLPILPNNRDTIYAYITSSQQLMALDSTAWENSAQLLTEAVEMAQTLEDKRAETYALGYLGRVYEKATQWSLAQSLTNQGLLVAQQIRANDIAYQWQWQLGRILHAQGKAQGAIEAYSAAVNYLKQLRGDLSITGSEEQFRFQEKVEPVYRELVSLLLTPDQKGDVSQEHLSQARNVMEAFHIAELDNFFQEACLETTYLQIDHVDTHAAVIYPILLSDRLEIILSRPNQPLRHYSSAITQTELTQFVDEFRNTLVIRSRFDFLPQAQQLYDWLIRPMASQLSPSEVDTLVFVLDGPLRQLPMAVLHDGSDYLIRHYRVSIAPGLTLVDSAPDSTQENHALVAGLGQSRHGFSSLAYVGVELDAIHSALSGSILFDESFTSNALEKKVRTGSFPLIHIASHGQFSSQPDQTFILAWDKHLKIQDLQRIFQTRYQQDRNSLELLVLSACETAAGDPQAPLGLAGMAVRAGARSTLATLWSVNDGVTAQFMTEFYRNLAANMTKAEALRQSQLWLLRHRRYNHPLYWAPYVLIGSWN